MVEFECPFPCPCVEEHKKCDSEKAPGAGPGTSLDVDTVVSDGKKVSELREEEMQTVHRKELK